LSWDVSDQSKVYANLARGFKSGGFNVGFGDGSQYDPETLTSFELGFKSTFEGGTRLNGAAFYYDYEDLQALTFDSATASSAIANASDATVYGVEFDLVSNITDNFLLSSGLSILNSEIDSIATPIGVLEDRELVLAPEISGNILGRYTQDLSSGGSVAYQLDGSFKSEHFFDVQNQAVASQDSYSVWNARVGWTSPSEKLELAFWVKNLFEEEYLVYTFDFTNILGFNQQFYGPPRWAGVSAKYSW